MPSPKSAPGDWIPAAAAARFLGVSVRQIQRREQQGHIEKRALDRLPGESMGRTLYSRADLEALKAGKPNVYAREVARDAGSNDTGKYDTGKYDTGKYDTGKLGSPARPLGETALAVRRSTDDPFTGFAAECARLAAVFGHDARPDPKPWLTLREAVAYSGLPRGYLLQMARDGGDFARDVSLGGARSRWMFNRAGLGKV